MTSELIALEGGDCQSLVQSSIQPTFDRATSTAGTPAFEARIKTSKL